ncbi:MAG: hypothetical protein QOG59_3731, partial [Solirubrobacteraceae bacterium]|nr:hypothetical protein [Solirubrobacteraceae bacterium]
MPAVRLHDAPGRLRQLGVATCVAQFVPGDARQGVTGPDHVVMPTAGRERTAVGGALRDGQGEPPAGAQDVG